MPRQMPRNGRPVSIANRTGSTSPSFVRLRHAGAEGADAGQHDAGGGRDPLRLASHLGSVAEALECLLHAPQVTHAVVDDGERAHARSLEDALGGEHPDDAAVALRGDIERARQ